MFFYTIVPPSEAHVVVGRSGKFIASSDSTMSGRRDYYAIPAGIPFIGRRRRILDITIQEIQITKLETIEKNQARYLVDASLKYRIKDVMKASETFTDVMDLNGQLTDIIKAAIRAVTVKYDVTEARSQKQEMDDKIRIEMADDLEKWGLELVNFQLGDFTDTKDSTIISDISKRREVEIHTTTREQNADKLKNARIKEAAADQEARIIEIQKDKTVAEKEQNKTRDIAEQEKLTQEKMLDVIRTKTIKQAEIDKEKAGVAAEQAKQVAIINANKEKEVTEIEKQKASINRDKMQLEGEGIRLKAQEQAIADAAPMLEKLKAEAEGKSLLQVALSKYDESALKALTAEAIVAANKDVGIATATALQSARITMFAGNGGKDAFDIGQLISAASLSNEKFGNALINKIARPNDIGVNLVNPSAVGKEIGEY